MTPGQNSYALSKWSRTLHSKGVHRNHITGNGPQLVGPFPVIELIGGLAYRLRLPPMMRIHDVISVAHLEPATDPAEDPYRRRRLPMPAVVVDGEDQYEIEKLLQKRRIRRGRGWSTQYLVRWLTYGPEDDTWETEQELRRHANDVVEAYEAANGPGVGIAREPPEPDRRQEKLAVVIPMRR